MTKAEKQSTEVAVFDQSAAKLNAMMGFVTRQKPVIPLLRLNSGDDEDANNAPSDTIVYDDGDNLLYTKTANIRVFFQGFQYRVFDQEKKKHTDMSIIAPNFDAEFRSMSGKIACGKLSKKKFEELGNKATAAQVEAQKKVKCKLILFGLVSGTFTNNETKAEVEITDQLFIWTVSGSAFIDMADIIKGIGKERRAIASTPIKLTLAKKKEGKVVYYVPISEVLADTVKMVPENMKHMDSIKNYVKDTNDYIESRYNNANRVGAENGKFAQVGKVIDGVATEVDMPNDPLDL